MHLVYRARRKKRYVENYPSSHLRMSSLAIRCIAFDATFGGIASLTKAGSIRCARKIGVLYAVDIQRELILSSLEIDCIFIRVFGRFCEKRFMCCPAT